MIDAHERVTGSIEYVVNLELPEMLHAKLLRSTSAHALIRSIDTSRARAVAGVRAVIVGSEVEQALGLFPCFGPIFRDQPILAIDRVRYVGEPVAAVAADDPQAALEAVNLIEVEYEELPAVFDVEAALADGAPLLHPGERLVGALLQSDIVNSHVGTNVCNHFKIRKGAVDAALESASHVFEDTFETPPLQHMSLEPHACVAVIGETGATFWTGTQTPFRVRDELAHVLGCGSADVRIVVPTLGGAYGNKCYPKIEPVVAALAKASGRPVKLVLTREEDSLTLTRHASRITLTTGVDYDGRIVARKALCLFNTGAYADIGPRVIKNAGCVAAGPYAIEDVWVDSYAVYTNLPPAGAFRGYGAAQSAWAYESQMDMIAERLGADPLDLRLRNVLVDGKMSATGEVMRDFRLKDLLSRAADAIGWDSAEPPKQRGSKVRAKGLSCTIKGMVTPSRSDAAVELGGDGMLTVLISSVEMGQGVKTAMAILGAERLGIPIARVRVSSVDTDATPYDQQTSSSRSTHCMGNAVVRAVDALREELLERGAALLAAAKEDVRVDSERIVHHSTPDRSRSFAEIVSASGHGRLVATGRYETTGVLDPETGQGVAAAHWHQGAAAAEVEVDLETGSVEVVRYEAVVYAGRVVNPVQAELQTEGNVAFGIGQALFEEMVFDSGQLTNPNLSEYMIPSMSDMPPIGVHLIEDEGDDPEIQGLGETALPAVSPAIGNAVARAISGRITSLPITPEKVLTTIRTNAAVEKPAEASRA